MSKVIYDAESTVLLRATGEAAITATESSAVELRVDFGATFVVAINVESIETSVADEVYTFSVEGLDADGLNPVTLGSLGAVSETGEYLLPIDADTAKKIAGDSVKQLQLTATLAGAAPSIAFSAWANPVVGSGRP